MSSDAPAPRKNATDPVTISAAKLPSGDWDLQVKVTVSEAPTNLLALLPMIHSLTDSIVDGGAQAAEAQGQKISCCQGCGACCRQFVPITEVEALYIGKLVDNLPEPRRTAVRARFADASHRLDQAGLLDPLRRRAEWVDAQSAVSFGAEYFRLGIACPFLEDESCSIHSNRPIVCREYLVVSPAEHCACPTPDTIDRVEMPVKVSVAVARCTAPEPHGRFLNWVPLVLAPEWAEEHPEEPPSQPGPAILNEFFAHLIGQNNQAARTAPDAGPF